MTYIIYSETKKNLYSTISQDKYCQSYNLRISNDYGQIIKKGNYISVNAAKQALKRFYRKEGI